MNYSTCNGDMTMTTQTRHTKAGSIFRLISLGAAVNGLLAASVSEVKGQHSTHDTYFVRRIPADFGVGFELEKTGDAELRHVLLNAPGGGHTCDCK
jgi:hypothetical protein